MIGLRRHVTRLASGVGLSACSAAAVLTLEHGFWASAAGTVVMGIIVLRRLSEDEAVGVAPARSAPDGGATAWRGLLDQVPTPLVRVGDGVQALNRAARTVFGTDDAVTPVPAALLDDAARRLCHEGRVWRLDRVATGTGPVPGPTLVALIDVEAERRLAEAHAEDEMVEVLGHELLNGLSPIVSLAESATVAAERGDAGLPALLATLARRADGLRQFVAAYRSLARLPAPTLALVPLRELVDDLRILFAAQPTPPPFIVERSIDATATIDRDQITQALWALLRNAVEAGGAAAPVQLSIALKDKRLSIDVVDAGSGVAMTDRSRIFRPFQTGKSDGSGVGLTLARRIARGHGGDVVLLDRTPTTFRLVLPAVLLEDDTRNFP